MLTRVARGVAGLEQERQARGDAARLDQRGDLAGSSTAAPREPRPRRVVHQQRRHGRAQPERRTSSAAARSVANVTAPHAFGERRPALRDVDPLRPQPRGLLARAEDHELAEFDLASPSSCAKLVERLAGRARSR